MPYFDIINSSKFQSFLIEHDIALPSNTSLDSSYQLRLMDCAKNNAKSVMLSYFDETRSREGNEFIRIHWFNGRSDDVFFVPDKPNKVMSAQEKQALQKRNEENERERQRQNNEAKARAYSEYLECGVPCKYHDYLKKKNIHPYYGVKVATKSISELNDEGITVFRIKKGDLIIPLVNAKKEFMTYQRITATGKKLMAGQTPKRGGFYPIGLWEYNATKRVILCEGYATGASIYEATQDVVLVCFDIGNIRAVCEQLRSEYPDVEVIIAADFDLNTNDQAGLINGLILAKQFGLRFIFPTQVKEGSDWNDLYLEQGPHIVFETIQHQLMQFKDNLVDNIIDNFTTYLNEKNYSRLAEAA